MTNPSTLHNEQQTTLIADVPYGSADGEPLLIDILHPDPVPTTPQPVIVEVHGGGWREGAKDAQRNALFAQHGFWTASINYRLSPQAPFPAQLADVKAALRWIRSHGQHYNLDAEHIGVWGHSAGGHLSALVGTSGDTHPLDEAHRNEPSTKVQAVVPVSPPVNMTGYGWEQFDDHDGVFRQLFGGPVHDHLELVRLADPLTYLKPDAPPFLIIHGDHDEIVPVAQADALNDALQAAGVAIDYWRIPGGDHGLDPYWPVIAQRALAFFQKHLMQH